MNSREGRRKIREAKEEGDVVAHGMRAEVTASTPLLDVGSRGERWCKVRDMLDLLCLEAFSLSRFLAIIKRLVET